MAPHSHALARMEEALGERRLAPDDPAHALLDAWATERKDRIETREDQLRRMTAAAALLPERVLFWTVRLPLRAK